MTLMSSICSATKLDVLGIISWNSLAGFQEWNSALKSIWHCYLSFIFNNVIWLDDTQKLLWRFDIYPHLNKIPMLCGFGNLIRHGTAGSTKKDKFLGFDMDHVKKSLQSNTRITLKMRDVCTDNLFLLIRYDNTIASPIRLKAILRKI